MDGREGENASADVKRLVIARMAEATAAVEIMVMVGCRDCDWDWGRMR